MLLNNNISWDPVLGAKIGFSAMFRVLSLEGNLVYEYNPFRNYRISLTMYLYNNRLYSPKELLIKLKYIELDSDLTEQECLKLIEGKGSWKALGIPDGAEQPVLLEPGELTDFETDELTFNLNYPIDIVPLYSYDGSVNLILNDGKNLPRLINSRFSPIGRNKYLIVDRKGDNDTNIYDLGDLFDVDTSLYKRTTTIAKLLFTGINYSGNLPIGNYHFYFKYEDADGNLTDYIAESGLVSIFIGNEPYNIYSGFRDLNSYKGCTFLLTNLDPSYLYIAVYYTRDTSDIDLNSVTHACKVELRYLINNANMCNVLITGYEDITEVTLEEINPNYLVVLDAYTLDTCQNMLFLANVHKTDVPYAELLDISLRFVPTVSCDDTYKLSDKINKNYELLSSDTYYNPKFIYNKVGYWPDEIYRFGIVYILSDNTLSPVFNVRGANLSDLDTSYGDYDFYDKDNKTRHYISFDELTYLISEDLKNSSKIALENVKGVIHTPSYLDGILSITFSLQKHEQVESMLLQLKIKGFFFVRLKRIPTTLCEAFTIGADLYSHVPAIPVLENNETHYLVERLLDDDLKITHDFITYSIPETGVDFAAICPEYDINPAYYNTIFCGDNFLIRKITEANLVLDITNERHFIMESKNTLSLVESTARIIAVEDNVKLVGIEDKMFSARAGEAEEGFRYEYIEYENNTTKAVNIVRGSYGPYLGITGVSIMPHSLIDIKIPNYSASNMSDYFNIRYQDKSSYLAISDRYSLEDLINLDDHKCTCYRGDCYICLFTHRVNRNFSDPSAPTNDKIVDEKCWKDHYEVSDGVVKTENFDEINLGDLNAKKMGMWVTVQIRATRNLCVRSLDDSIPDEQALYGLPRAFYPYQPMSTSGVYKIPEALCYNDGFSKGLSYRYNFEVPDVPYIKNEFTNRILYSDIHVNDAFTNGFRTFQGTHYRDYPKTYGQITRIIEFRGNLICVFEHGVALIPVNERAVAGEGAGGNVYINTSNVLPENPRIVSDKYGSQWRESIIKTPLGIYGVDTVAKKIWYTDGEQFLCISDFVVLEFLNQNISLTERELDPIIGIRNVKTHYNAFKLDVMFTFYDNLYGFEEKVWNLCFNEYLLKWITFYSWIPSYSENIYNLYFSFDRNTSKWIAKLGVSLSGNNFSDGVTVDNVIIKDNNYLATLSLSNRNFPTGDGATYTINYVLERDNYNNYTKFKIEGDKLIFTGNYDDITSELYLRNSDGSIAVDERGRRQWLAADDLVNPDKIVLYLNIRADIKVDWVRDVGEVSLNEAYVTGFTNQIEADALYYQSTLALIPEYNILFLTTDFWKHGQAGIIDIADKIYPTYWYGKLHPFEFEFVVADNPQAHKIFDNLQIISNHAEPESFHYEIIGDCFDFAEDKKNMYIRQEATRELYQYNGFDTTYDHKYSELDSVHRPLETVEGLRVYNSSGLPMFEKSTILPLTWYARQDRINDIEDYYHSKDGLNTKDFAQLAGGEIVRYENLDEYRIWNHAKAVNMQTHRQGRLRGNMLYNEDKWLVQINPINIVQRNEPDWSKGDLTGNLSCDPNKVPVELGQSPIPDEILSLNTLNVPEDMKDRAIVSWGDMESQNKEIKVKDKWIKVRVRYTGDLLAIISAIKTLYSISYS